MLQTNPPDGKTKEIQVVAGLKVVETEYRVKSAVFEEEIVKRPKFVDEEIKIPVGFEKVVNHLASEISKVVISMIDEYTVAQLKLVEEKIMELKNLKTEETVVFKTKDVEVERPVFKDVLVDKVVFVDKEVINPVLKDVEVINPIIIDKKVVNSIISDIRVTNAIIKDVEVERAVIREKIIDVVHKNCYDPKGNPLV